jgi:hypothetical protein
VITFNEEEPTASVWTASEVIYRRLKKQGYQPAEDEERHAVFTMPKAVVKVLRSRAKRILTPEHKEALRQGLLKRRASSTEEGNGHDSAMSKG